MNKRTMEERIDRLEQALEALVYQVGCQIIQLETKQKHIKRSTNRYGVARMTNPQEWDKVVSNP